jgi:DNA mismatch repair protein MutS
MISYSILFESPEHRATEESLEAPDFFGDLNLDQVIDTITAGRQEYNLKPFFYASLKDIEAVRFRHEVMQDLDGTPLFQHITAFAQRMREMRDHLAQADKRYYLYQKERWFLEAVELYCDAVKRLVHDLSRAEVRSRGFLAIREYLTRYAESDRFTSLAAETQTIKADLSAIQYCVLIRGSAVTVRKYDGEVDYSAEVEQTFEKFKQGAVQEYRVKFSTMPDMNHVEAQILDFVARLYPEAFLHLDTFCAENRNFADKTIATFDREIQFYLAYLEYVTTFKNAGLGFCYPQMSNDCKAVCDHDAFDLALAHKLIGEKSSVVCNDFYLEGPERVFVVSGPNQGGKTTFARTFGQLHHLASLGCPVPGTEAKLFLFDRIFAHFEREETITNLRGKLQDDLVRVHEILTQATPNSIVIMNEIFTSTTLQDATFLSERVMERIIELDLLCVWVTFIDELASRGAQTVSMVSTVVPDDPASRTYKIIRKPADGLAYALSIAEKYRLTYGWLKKRLSMVNRRVRR